MSFEPIAVVGRSCVLPGALDPGQLWDGVLAGRCAVTAARPGAASDDNAHAPGGYVSGFDEVFDPDGFRIGPDRIAGFDRGLRWVLHCAREALRDCGRGEAAQPAAGLVLGTLAYPSAAAARYADQIWLEAQSAEVRAALGVSEGARPDPRDRFFAGLPARLAAEALGLGAGAFALDAACASGLYAIKFACDRLHDRGAELMLAGAVNCADHYVVHDGFRALGALSLTGRSRPFDRAADGLVPAEGAAFVALMRLRDAVERGVPVHGVIRGIGWSTNGRGRGLLVPSVEGQVRALSAAYEAAGLAPHTVSLLECHATGTSVGDACELDSAARVFADVTDLPIGSIKSNLGHPLAAAGIAGLLKVLGAAEAGVRPPTLGIDEPVEALAGGPLRPLLEAEEWLGPRRAGVSAFGFGGTNAHLVVDGPAERHTFTASVPALPPHRDEPVAVVALGCRGAAGADLDELRRRLATGVAAEAPDHLDVPVAGLAFPPDDLRQAVAQQLLVLEAARDAVHGLALPRDRTMVLIGSGAPLEIARFGLTRRIAEQLTALGLTRDPELRTDVRDASGEQLTAAAVIGSMPNIVANRINAQFDFAGPGCAVFAEEASGLVALELAIRALRRGEADAAVVGGVDAARDPVHRAALDDLGLARTPSDAAIVLVVKRLADAERDGDDVLAVLVGPDGIVPELLVADEAAAVSQTAVPRTAVPRTAVSPTAARRTAVTRTAGPQAVGPRAAVPVFDPARRFGTPHAAAGLLAVAVAVLALRHRLVPRPDGPADPAPGIGAVEVAASVLGVAASSLTVRAATPAPWSAQSQSRPRLHVYSGTDRGEVLAALSQGRESAAGPARLVLSAVDEAEHAALADAARRWLTSGGEQPVGAAYRDAPVGGEVAFVFTNGSAAYPGMGRELMLAFPEEAEAVVRRHRFGALHGGRRSGPAEPDDALDMIRRTTALAAFHAQLSREVLRIEPAAALGYSSGEVTALAALGAWNDFGELVDDCRASELFTSEIAGEHRALRRAWQAFDDAATGWSAHAVMATAERVREALVGVPGVHLMAVNAPGACVIGGEPRACSAVLERLGGSGHVPLEYDIAAHVPELEPLRAEFHRLHLRATTTIPRLRYYSSVDGACLVEPSAEQAAAAVARQAVSALDFPRAVEQAWADGVRVFVEHGPRSLCTGWIRRILGSREHLCVALDATDDGARHFWAAAAELVAAGVAYVPAHAALERRTAAEERGSALTVRLPVQQRAAVRLVLAQPDPVVLPRAPRLPLAVGDSRPGARESTSPESVGAAVGVRGARWRPDGVLSSLAGAHQGYLAAGAEAHARFLQHRKTLITGLSAALGNAAPSDVGPLPAAAPVRAPQAAVRPSAAGQLPAAVPADAPQATVRPSGTDGLPAAVPVRAAQAAAGPSGPTFDRAELERLASGRISELFGPAFAAQDGYRRQTRLPRPPLLLVDRVTGLDAEPASLGAGTIWTETRIPPGAWYLDAAGAMPSGLMMEAGQADLLLLSWLGADLRFGGERVYRLLGCRVTFHGGPARPGETLRFAIQVERHVEYHGVGLFFFRYDCHVGDELRITVRDGQAGYFTPAELAASKGVGWDPGAHCPPGEPPRAVPASACTRARFDADAVRAFAEGRPQDCFGAAWSGGGAPGRLVDPRLRRLDSVTEFDPVGGPWRRGFLRAHSAVSPDEWFFAGHFLNDPCMPGTLMFDGCLQAMRFYLTAVEPAAARKDRYIEPVAGEPIDLVCRGQVTPDTRSLTYEVHVIELRTGPEPVLYADLLCIADGRQAFHARRVGLRLKERP